MADQIMVPDMANQIIAPDMAEQIMAPDELLIKNNDFYLFYEMMMQSLKTDNVKEGLLAQIPAKKLGDVADIANAVEFLAKDDSAYITGQVIHVNGGLYM